MGGGAYYSDVRVAREAIGTRRSSFNAFDYSARASSGSGPRSVHKDLNVLNRIRECCDSPEHPDTTPIVPAMDVTSSRGRDAKVIYEQMESFLAAIVTSGIVPDPQIAFAGIGDANVDLAPLQLSQFESDRRIDQCLKQLWLEEGGGGTGEESYELLAYYLAYKTALDANKRGKKGFLFFTGDEAPYPQVSAAQVKTYIGEVLKRDVPTEQVFKALQKKFHTFLIYPGSSAEQRKAAIDTEIRQRLIKAGGRFKDVAIRCSLRWETRDDLDLHCLTPSGQHIYYGHKCAELGELDVDRNVYGEDPKPVENIRWAKGEAPEGTYRFWVENYRYHPAQHQSSDRGPAIPFKVELDVEGDIQTFEGNVPANSFGERSAQQAFSFKYKANQGKGNPDHLAAYSDEVVLAKWRRYIPDTHIFRIQDPESALEVMLGAMALQTGKMTLPEFAANMRERRVSKEVCKDAETALATFAKRGIVREVAADLFK